MYNLYFFRSLRPVIVEPYEIVDDIDGHSEKNLPKKNPDYYKEREVMKSFLLYYNNIFSYKKFK